MKKLFVLILMMTSLISSGQNATVNDLWKLYNSHDYESAIEKAKPLLEKDPNNVDLNLLIGRSLTDLADYKNALPYLALAEKNDRKNSWQKAWALNYMGTCYYMLKDYRNAELLLSECIKLNATKNATNDAYAKTLVFGLNDFFRSWNTVETENFCFHFQNMSTEEIEKFTSIRELAYREINSFFKSFLLQKIDFYVWESREDAKKIMNSNLGFAMPGFYIVHSHYQQTIGHEMVHVISHYSTKIISKAGLINEGTAVCFDQTKQDKEQIVKDWLKANDKKISIEEIWANWNDFPEDLKYPLAGLFVKELIDNFGREKFIDFFGNQTYENAKLVFGDNLGEVISAFENKFNT